MNRSVGDCGDDDTDVAAQSSEVVSVQWRAAASVTAHLDNYKSAAGQSCDFDVVLGDVGHSGNKDDRRPAVVFVESR